MRNERFRYSSKFDYMNKNFEYSTLSEIMAEGLTETLKREVKFNTVECAKFRFKATQNPLIIKPRLVNTGGENTCIHIA